MEGLEAFLKSCDAPPPVQEAVGEDDGWQSFGVPEAASEDTWGAAETWNQQTSADDASDPPGGWNPQQDGNVEAEAWQASADETSDPPGGWNQLPDGNVETGTASWPEQEEQAENCEESQEVAIEEQTGPVEEQTAPAEEADGGEGVHATSLGAYKAKARIILADGQRYVDDGDDDDIMAPGVAHAFGGYGGNQNKVCWQGKKCKKRNCQWFHPHGRDIDDSPDDTTEQKASWEEKPKQKNWVVAAKAKAAAVWEEAAKAKAKAKAALPTPRFPHPEESAGSKSTNATPKPKATTANATPKSKARATAAIEEREEPSASDNIGEACHEDEEEEEVASKKRKVVETSPPEINEVAEEETVEFQNLTKDNKRLKTKLEIAELRAENAELKLKNFEKQVIELEILEKELLATASGKDAYKDVWAQPDRPRQPKGAAKGGAKKDNQGSKGSGKKTGGGKPAKEEDDICWSFKKGHCKAGNKCKWSHG